MMQDDGCAGGMAASVMCSRFGVKQTAQDTPVCVVATMYIFCMSSFAWHTHTHVHIHTHTYTHTHAGARARKVGKEHSARTTVWRWWAKTSADTMESRSAASLPMTTVTSPPADAACQWTEQYSQATAHGMVRALPSTVDACATAHTSELAHWHTGLLVHLAPPFRGAAHAPGHSSERKRNRAHH